MPRRLLRRSKRAWLSPSLWKRRVLFWLGAIAVGAVAVVFALGAESANAYFHALLAASSLLPLVVTPAGLALVVYLTRRFAPAARGSGIPQTLAALQTADDGVRRNLLSLRAAGAKLVLTLLAILSGASVGREGPSVQIGAAIMHRFGGMVAFPRREMQHGLILAGSAAGIAAAFNTPLAGIVFAIEQLSRSFEQRTSGTVLTTVILAGIVSLAFLGNYTYFGRTSAVLIGPGQWSAVVVCGIVGGVLGGMFSTILIASARGLPGRVGQFAQARPVAFAAACGVVLAVLGLLSGNTIYGTGYMEAQRILEGGELPLFYGVLKLAATAVSFISGVPGGIFAPSLSVGAGIGANIAAFMPEISSGAVIILAMVAYFAGVSHAPISAFVIVMEMTDNHNMVVPLMAAAVIAYGASRLVCPRSLYHVLAEQFLSRIEPKPR